MFRNWPAICNVEDPILRLLVSTTEDPKTLWGLRQGFPELFTEEKSLLRIPASAIRAKQRELILQEEADELKADFGNFAIVERRILYDWEEGVNFFNIPFALRTDDNAVPWEIEAQLIGTVLLAGNKVMYHGQECIVVEVAISASWPDGSFYTGRQGGVLNVTLVPAKFIDLNA